MAAVAETFINCTGSTISIDSVAYGPVVVDGGYNLDMGVDDMTSGAFYQDVSTVRKADGNITIGYLVTSPLAALAEGVICPFIIDCPNGPYISGNARINSLGNPVFARKAGFKQAVKFTFQGTFTTTRP